MNVINFPIKRIPPSVLSIDEQFSAVANLLKTGETKEVVVLMANRDGSISEIRIVAPSTFQQALPA